MRVLIAYASLTGCSEDVAKYIMDNSSADFVKIVNLSKTKSVDLTSFDKVIFGTGIYFFKIHSAVKCFILKNYKTLMKKDFGVYICCGAIDPKRQKTYINCNFTNKFKKSAIAITCVGGKFNYKRVSFPRSIIIYLGIKLFRKKEQLPLNINYGEVNKFVEKMMTISKK
jgi:menaquinone-dependent protoporphyrinogen oxidase